MVGVLPVLCISTEDPHGYSELVALVIIPHIYVDIDIYINIKPR